MPTKPRVLLVDDEEHNLSTFHRVFRRDFDVATAESGREGLTKVGELTFDVVLADYSMPHMTGVEFLRRVREAKPQVVRFLMTAYPDAPEVLKAKEQGLVREVIEKPWTRQGVLDWVHASLRAGQDHHD